MGQLLEIKKANIDDAEFQNNIGGIKKWI